MYLCSRKVSTAPQHFIEMETNRLIIVSVLLCLFLGASAKKKEQDYPRAISLAFICGERFCQFCFHDLRSGWAERIYVLSKEMDGCDKFQWYNC